MGRSSEAALAHLDTHGAAVTHAATIYSTASTGECVHACTLLKLVGATYTVTTWAITIYAIKHISTTYSSNHLSIRGEVSQFC